MFFRSDNFSRVIAGIGVNFDQVGCWISGSFRFWGMTSTKDNGAMGIVGNYNSNLDVPVKILLTIQPAPTILHPALRRNTYTPLVSSARCSGSPEQWREYASPCVDIAKVLKTNS